MSHHDYNIDVLLWLFIIAAIIFVSATIACVYSNYKAHKPIRKRMLEIGNAEYISLSQDMRRKKGE